MSAPSQFSVLFAQLPEELQERVDIIRHKLKFMENKPTVFCAGQIDPLTTVNNLADMLNIAGGTTADSLATDPDIIILMPEGASVAHTMGGINTLLAYPGFAELKAVKNNRVYIADGERYFHQNGEVMVESLEILAEIINPKQFNFGYEGDAWIKFSL
ncbi:hypothetical protein FFF34_018160 [Inquilinus sp. KBS0705]|nr:hypothetical protein FFF34_018160 [Inquilinus sp. KBS0705]